MTFIRRAALLILAALILIIAPSAALAATPEDYDISAPQSLTADQLYAQSAVLIDADSGEVLLSKDSRVRMYPASTTKVMTLLLALESGRDLDEWVTLPREAGDVPQGSSVVPVKPGDGMTYRDLLVGFMLSSGNDGANAAAVLTAGDIPTFVERMNARAQALGCENTHFVNAHGYHDAGHYSSAMDLALIARAAMQNEAFRYIVAQPSWEMTITRGEKTIQQTIENRNSLLVPTQKYYYADCTGIKTGHHNKAGWCFVGSAERNGRSLICVVLNCDEEAQKWYDAARLFEYGFTRYEDVPIATLLEKGAARYARVQVANAAADDAEQGWMTANLERFEGGASVPVITGSDASMEAAVAGVASRAQVTWTNALTAPIKAGAQLGTVTWTGDDGETVTARLVASRSVQRRPADGLRAVPGDGTTEGSGRVIRVVLVVLATLLLAAVGAMIALQRRQKPARRPASRGRRGAKPRARAKSTNSTRGNRRSAANPRSENRR